MWGVFWPANGCSARPLLVEIKFLTLKQLFAYFLVIKDQGPPYINCRTFVIWPYCRAPWQSMVTQHIQRPPLPIIFNRNFHGLIFAATFLLQILYCLNYGTKIMMLVVNFLAIWLDLDQACFTKVFEIPL